MNQRANAWRRIVARFAAGVTSLGLLGLGAGTVSADLISPAAAPAPLGTTQAQTTNTGADSRAYVDGDTGADSGTEADADADGGVLPGDSANPGDETAPTPRHDLGTESSGEETGEETPVEEDAESALSAGVRAASSRPKTTR